MGGALSPAALRIFVMDLAHLPDESIRHGLERTRREVKGSNGFAPRLILQDVLDRAGVVTESSAEEMEGISAWDTVMMIAEKFVKVKISMDGDRSDPVLRKLVGKPIADCAACKGSGRYLVLKGEDRWVADCPCRPVEVVPMISDRITDVVTRMGGWGMFKDISQRSFPFVRRDFLLEFGRWKKVESYRSMLPSGENMLTLGRGGEELATENNTPHRLDGLLDKILTSDSR